MLIVVIFLLMVALLSENGEEMVHFTPGFQFYNTVIMRCSFDRAVKFLEQYLSPFDEVIL